MRALQSYDITAARNLLLLGALIPHRCEITDSEVRHVGQFSLRDRYERPIDDASSVPNEPIIAAAPSP